MEQTQKEQSLIVLQKRLPMLVTMAVAIVLCCAVVMNFTRAWYSNNLDASAEGMQIISESPDVAYSLTIYRSGYQVYPKNESPYPEPLDGLLPGEEYIFLLKLNRDTSALQSILKLDVGFLGIEGYPLGTTYSVITNSKAAQTQIIKNAGNSTVEIFGDSFYVVDGAPVQNSDGSYNILPAEGKDWAILVQDYAGYQAWLEKNSDGSLTDTELNNLSDSGQIFYAKSFLVSGFSNELQKVGIPIDSTTSTTETFDFFTFPPELIDLKGSTTFTVTGAAYTGREGLYKVTPAKDANGNLVSSTITIYHENNAAPCPHTSSQFTVAGYNVKENDDGSLTFTEQYDGSGQVSQVLGTIQAGTGSYSTQVFNVGVYKGDPILLDPDQEKNLAQLQFQTLQEILEEFQKVGVEGQTSVFTEQTLQYSTAMDFDKNNQYLYQNTWGAMSKETQSLVIPFAIKISTAQDAKDKQIILSASDLSNIAFKVDAIYINSVPDESGQGGQS